MQSDADRGSLGHSGELGPQSSGPGLLGHDGVQGSTSAGSQSLTHEAEERLSVVAHQRTQEVRRRQETQELVMCEA